MKLSHDSILYLAATIAVMGIVSSSYLTIQNKDQESQIKTLEQERDFSVQTNNQKNAELEVASVTITELHNDLSNIKKTLEDLADDYRDEKKQNDKFEDQIRDLAGTLGDLDKLAKLDTELLAKYSKVYFLNENFIPEKLEQIPSRYILDGKDVQFFHAYAINHLKDMFKSAARDSVDLQVVSAYRSFDEQASLKGQFTQVYGEGANTFSADQGYSEHQLGTTVDITVESVGGTYNSFSETKAFTWLEKNAYKYGFILSYPEDNDFYIYEPWHWRFVGTELAKHLDRSRNDTFYSMEQREIDDYLLEFFD